ncbi:nucleotidyltransferase domain-containing protein [Desulfobacter latus]|uniref:Nucleotidyltransferase family protein n=1 Tax=Desulfobacter latus TaxID=2292 RepID=A0A850SPJ0_9BACT|nr:nucleotidyltransferase family protein [Desulfobacter latus]NWH03394.1 nucleotidyltransferase family protein [Desulfobacter latus]
MTISQFPPELSLLTTCLRQFNREAPIDGFEKRIGKGMDWHLFFQLVERHRVAVQAYHSLKRLPQGHVDPHILNRLKNQSGLVVQRSLAITAQLASLAQQFDDARIPFLAFKGPIAGYDLYGNPGVRQMRDLDILVDPDQLTRAETVLRERGYHRTVPDFTMTARQFSYYKKNQHHFVYAHPEKTCVVELHWRLFNNPALLPMEYRTLWQHKREIKVGHQRVRTFGPEHTFLILSIHGSKHHWNRLFWLNDIARLMRKEVISDWSEFIERVKGMGLERMVAEAVFLSHRILGTSLPEPVRQIISGDSVIQKMIHRSLFLIASPEGRIFPFSRAYWYIRWHKTYLVQNIRYHLWYAGMNAGPRLGDMKNVPLPDPLFPLYYLIRPFTWFNRFFIQRK